MMDNHSTEQTGIPACWYKISGITNIKLENIPTALKTLPQWVAWKAVDKGDGKKPTKVPVNPTSGGQAMTNIRATWGSFDAATRRATDDRLAGIGLMFTGDDLVGIDLDGVYDLQGGRFTNPLAEAFVRSFDSYTEVSPSGKGVKLWIKSSIHPTRCIGKISRLNETVDYETYYKSRWFAVSGHVLPQYGDGQIQDRTVTYGRMLAEIASQKAPRQANTAAAVVPASGSVDDEAAMLRAALKRINADAEGTWFRMACCLKWWGAQDGVGDARARALWDEWSRSSEDKFDPTSQEERWQRIVPDGGLTIGTIFAAAMEEGYVHGDALASDGREYRIERVRPIEADLAAPASGNNLPSEEKPIVELHGVGGWSRVSAVDAADHLGRVCSECGELFGRNGAVVYVRQGRTITVEAHDLAVVASRHARLMLCRQSRGKDGQTERLLPTTATPAQCNDILAAREFVDRLPPLRLICRCPVLVEDGKGGLRVVRGYDRESGVYATSGDAVEMPLDEATALICDALSDFDFATPGDRSRAIAAMITPAMVMGGLLPGRAPVDLGEADDSQSGKGYRQRLDTAIYNDVASVVSQRKGGSGSTEESYCTALISGACFVTLDNVRGRLDSPLIESSLTEPFCDARTPYGKPVQVDMRRVCVSMTSNAAELTRDLANRTSPVRIRKRPAGYVFRTYPEGDLLAHVAANQGNYLGAVFAVVRAWADAGRPMEADCGHDFRGWARTMDWIVRHLFGATPLCDGVKATQTRMSSPHIGWAREVAILVAREGLLGQPLRAHQIVRLLEDCGAEVPGVEHGCDLSDDANFKKANQAVGRRLSSAFGKTSSVLEIDDMTITRNTEMDDGKDVHTYVFACVRRDPKRVESRVTEGAEQPDPLLGGLLGGPLGGNQKDRQNSLRPGGILEQIPPNEPSIPPNVPPIIPPEKVHIPPIPPNDTDTFDRSRNNTVVNTLVRKNGNHQADQAENNPRKGRDWPNIPADSTDWTEAKKHLVQPGSSTPPDEDTEDLDDRFLLEDSTETITAAMVTVAAGVATSMAISTSTMVLSDEPLTLMLGNESFGTSDSEVRL